MRGQTAASTTTKNTMRNRTHSTWVTIIALALCVCCAETILGDDGLVVTLSIKEKTMPEGTPVLLLLNAQNRGTLPIRLIRPRGTHITRIQEHGWVIEVTGPQGAYGVLPEPRGVKPVVDEDIIILAPGELVGAEISIGHYVLLSQPTRPLHSVGNTPGSYRAILRYNGNKGGPFLLKTEKLDALFRGPVSAAPVEFEIVTHEEKPNK
jgi:hypothetical protein